MTSGDAPPVIILGAARSGTNILRDVLTRAPGLVTWPCDEINYIWRYGNARHPTDALPAPAARPRVREYIRARFEALGRRRAGRVVEKTCANTLRVPFVDRVMPEAVFVHIIRDGRDVTLSAMQRWTAPVDVPYVLAKARFVPTRDVPYYAARYMGHRLRALFDRHHRLPTWGPRFEGIEEWARTGTLEELAAAQWRACVEASLRDLADIDPERVCTIRYEDFTRDPPAELRRVLDFLEVSGDPVELGRGVSPSSVGRWRDALTDEQRQRIEPLLGATLQRCGYDA